MAKDLCTLFAEARRTGLGQSCYAMNPDPEKRSQNKRRLKEKYAKKYKRIMENE